MAMQPYFSGHPFSYSRWRRSFMYQQSRTFLSAMQAINLHTKEIITLFVVGLGWPSKWSLRKIFHFCSVCFIPPLHGSSDKKKTHYILILLLHDKKQKKVTQRPTKHKDTRVEIRIWLGFNRFILDSEFVISDAVTNSGNIAKNHSQMSYGFFV